MPDARTPEDRVAAGEGSLLDTSIVAAKLGEDLLEARAEVERLTAEVERLRAAGADLIAHPRSSRARLRMHDACGTSPLDGLAEIVRDRAAAKRAAASTASEGQSG